MGGDTSQRQNITGQNWNPFLVGSTDPNDMMSAEDKQAMLDALRRQGIVSRPARIDPLDVIDEQGHLDLLGQTEPASRGFSF